jgi:uroporphyrin-3 C-methyltransferase
LFFLAGLIILGYYAYNMQQQLDQIQEQNAQDTNLVKNLTLQAKQSLVQLDKQKQDDIVSKQQLQSLKTEVVDAQSQLVKLKQSSDWALAEANYLTFMANMRIKSANDVQTALVQLTAADDRLREVGNPGLDWVRATLAKDIARLKSMPQVNRQMLWEQIEALSNSFYQLHFKRLDEALKQQDDVKIDGNLPAWRQALLRSWAELKGLIKVSKQEQNSVPLALSIQEQSQIMRTMQLLGMQAQWALLEGQDKIYQGSLKALHGWLEKYFENTEIQKNMLAQIQELESQQIALAIPDVDASIQALAQAMKSQSQNVKKDIKS